jgi:hypothetical protein
VRQLVFFVEEQSAKEMLNGLLPRLINDKISCVSIHFEGKQDLEKQLERRIRGWKNPDTLFVVLRDQDSGDCVHVKNNLINICNRAGRPDALVRIICHELESWFLGDLQAVESGLGTQRLSAKQNKHKFRDPDRLSNPKQELKKLTNNKYQPILGARKIGSCLSLTNNRSNSFNVFISGIVRLLEIETSV